MPDLNLSLDSGPGSLPELESSILPQSPLRWFTSDHHFFHENIIKYCRRPHATVDDMNVDLISRWNEVVAEEDEVYVLGDLSLGKWDELFAVLDLLNGTRHLIVGNHDQCFRKPSKASRYLEAGFVEVVSSTDLLIANRTVHLNHFPYLDDDTDARHPDKRLEDDGTWLLCGHIHDKWRQKGKQINVGVDCWDFYPVAETEIAEMIAKGPRDLGPVPHFSRFPGSPTI